MIRILFVCLGNICRSPMAEGVMRDMIHKHGLSDQVQVDSCGTAAYHAGSLPDTRARQVCQQNGIELTHHARRLEEKDFKEFHYIVAMDEQNLADIVSRKPTNSTSVISLMTGFGPAERTSVPDPYYDDLEAFHGVYSMLRIHCEQLLSVIKQSAVEK